MKKIGLLFLNICLLILVSCGTSSENKQLISEIEDAVETMNESCPYYVGLGNDVTLEKVTFGDKTLTYHFSIRIVQSEIGQNEELKRMLLHGLKGETELTHNNLIPNIIKIGGKVVYTYSSKSGKSYSIELTNKDLKEVFH